MYIALHAHQLRTSRRPFGKHSLRLQQDQLQTHSLPSLLPQPGKEEYLATQETDRGSLLTSRCAANLPSWALGTWVGSDSRRSHPANLSFPMLALVTIDRFQPKESDKSSFSCIRSLTRTYPEVPGCWELSPSMLRSNKTASQPAR